jgi:hypothetical protein
VVMDSLTSSRTGSAVARSHPRLGRRHVAAATRVARPRVHATGRSPLVAATPLPQRLRRVAEVLGAAQPTPTPYIALPTDPTRVAGDNQSLRLASAA